MEKEDEEEEDDDEEDYGSPMLDGLKKEGGGCGCQRALAQLRTWLNCFV